MRLGDKMGDKIHKADECTYTKTSIELCAICGRLKEDTHHLIFGTSDRKLADQDGITIPLCRECHEKMHRIDSTFSKMIGQLMWERWYLADYGDADGALKEARESFVERYGKSYL